MALACLIALYSIGGGIVLFMYGRYFWFLYPEVQIDGGISMAIGAISVLLLLGFANSSYSALLFLPLSLTELTPSFSQCSLA
jgi:hypothetical protein